MRSIKFWCQKLFAKLLSAQSHFFTQCDSSKLKYKKGERQLRRLRQELCQSVSLTAAISKSIASRLFSLFLNSLLTTHMNFNWFCAARCVTIENLPAAAAFLASFRNKNASLSQTLFFRLRGSEEKI